MHDLVCDRAAQTPDAVAVIDADGEHTYGELDERSRAAGAAPASLGVGSGDVVGVSLPRGAPLVAALLGVLRAGAAFLPLEPDLPAARLEFILEDSGTASSLATTALGKGLPAGVRGARARRLGRRRWWVVAGGGVGEVAWVVYTSGSSGVPKGVLGSQRGLVNRVGWGWRAQPYRGRGGGVVEDAVGVRGCDRGAVCAAGGGGAGGGRRRGRGGRSRAGWPG